MRVKAIYIYTDGSSNNSKTLHPNFLVGGFAAVILSIGVDGLVINVREYTEYENNISSNVAELRAIELAVKKVKPNQSIPVYICSDSEYAIKAVTGVNKVYANFALIEEIKHLLEERSNIEFIKVKSHTGDKWNERADLLAGKARLEGLHP